MTMSFIRYKVTPRDIICQKVYELSMSILRVVEMIFPLFSDMIDV